MRDCGSLELSRQNGNEQVGVVSREKAEKVFTVLSITSVRIYLLNVKVSVYSVINTT